MSHDRDATPAERDSAVRAGSAVVLDQILFAASSGLLMLLLGRELPPEEYGAFALAYSLVLLLAHGQTALLAEPMSVYGPTRYRTRQEAYVHEIQRLNHRAALIATGCLILSAAVLAALGRQPMAGALLGAGIAAPALMSVWLRRRVLYLQGRIWRSALASALLLAGCVAGVFVLRGIGAVNALSAMVLLAVASLAARLTAPRSRPGTGPPRSEVVRGHWEYGRWALLTAFLGWCGNLYYFLLPFSHGFEGVASLRALMNFIYPMIQLNQAFALFLLPRWAARVTFEAVGPSLSRAAWSWTLLSLAVGLAALVVGAPAIHWVYGGRYDDIAPLLPWAILLVLGDGVAYYIGCGLRACRMPDRVALAALPVAVAAVFPGILLVHLWGPRGAVVAMLIASAGQLSLNWFGWKRSGSSPGVGG